VERNPSSDSTARDEGAPSRRPFRSLRRLGAIAKRPDGRKGFKQALEADALLLREENARLRVKLESPPNVGAVIEQLRALPTIEPTRSMSAPPPSVHDRTDADNGEGAWHMLTELLVIRNSLIEICGEIGQVMASLEQSLKSLSLPLDHVGDGNGGNGNVRNGFRAKPHLEEARES
jgi:hypothetical protein